MSDPREQDFVAGAKQDHLYTAHFQSGAGKFFNVVTTDDGDTTIEYEEPHRMKSRIKMTLTFIKESGYIKEVVFKKFKFYKRDGWQEQHFGPDEPFTLRHFTFQKLISFLSLLSELDLASLNERRIPLVQADGRGIDVKTAQKVKTLLLQPDGQAIIEELIRSGLVTSRDIVNVGYRKRQLTVFEQLLRGGEFLEQYAVECGITSKQPERIWQHFLSRNEWIFGYGLDYRFLGILQTEARLGTEDLAGHDSAVGDFLLGAKSYTVLVEVKRPDTPLFAEDRNRANSWRLSRQLVEAVSQILEQKASWQIKSETNAGRNYDTAGNRIKQRTIDPKCYLIIGSDKMLTGSDREREIKLRTFELFRRDSRNIEILTYSELFERASFIVDHESRALPAN